MAASLMALILIGTDLLSYSNSMSNAKKAFDKKNYTEAYAYVAGMDVKEEDFSEYKKYETIAFISSEYDAYKTFIAEEFYDLALDSLIRMRGRCDKYRDDALMYECIKELEALAIDAENMLKETFKLSKEEALELYYYRDRREYSTALKAVLKELGMEKVRE